MHPIPDNGLTDREKLAALSHELKIGMLANALEEALDGWEESAQYKGEYLAKKHGDADRINELRTLLSSLGTRQ